MSNKKNNGFSDREAGKIIESIETLKEKVEDTPDEAQVDRIEKKIDEAINVQENVEQVDDKVEDVKDTVQRHARYFKYVLGIITTTVSGFLTAVSEKLAAILPFLK